jgi:hypothetical protein
MNDEGAATDSHFIVIQASFTWVSLEANNNSDDDDDDPHVILDFEGPTGGGFGPTKTSRGTISIPKRVS